MPWADPADVMSVNDHVLTPYDDMTSKRWTCAQEDGQGENAKPEFLGRWHEALLSRELGA